MQAIDAMVAQKKAVLPPWSILNLHVSSAQYTQGIPEVHEQEDRKKILLFLTS